MRGAALADMQEDSLFEGSFQTEGRNYAMIAAELRRVQRFWGVLMLPPLSRLLSQVEEPFVISQPGPAELSGNEIPFAFTT